MVRICKTEDRRACAQCSNLRRFRKLRLIQDWNKWSPAASRCCDELVGGRIFFSIIPCHIGNAIIKEHVRRGILILYLGTIWATENKAVGRECWYIGSTRYPIEYPIGGRGKLFSLGRYIFFCVKAPLLFQRYPLIENSCAIFNGSIYFFRIDTYAACRFTTKKNISSISVFCVNVIILRMLGKDLIGPIFFCKKIDIIAASGTFRGNVGDDNILSIIRTGFVIHNFSLIK